MATTSVKQAPVSKQVTISIQQELSELQTRLLYSGFAAAYPDVSKRLFRDLTTKQRDGREPLPSFVSSRIGLYLLKRFHQEKSAPAPITVEEPRIISADDIPTRVMAVTAGK